jgi:uncharacterized membrane protein
MTKEPQPLPDAHAKNKMTRASQFGLLAGVGLFIAFPLPKTGTFSDVFKVICVAALIVALVYRQKLKRGAKPSTLTE